jgi:hypothetical protein
MREAIGHLLLDFNSDRPNELQAAISLRIIDSRGSTACESTASSFRLRPWPSARKLSHHSFLCAVPERSPRPNEMAAIVDFMGLVYRAHVCQSAF